MRRSAIALPVRPMRPLFAEGRRRETEITRSKAEAERAGTAAADRDIPERHPTEALADKATKALALAEGEEARRDEEGERAPGDRSPGARAPGGGTASEERRARQERQGRAGRDARIRHDLRDAVACSERGQFHAQRGETAAAIADFDESRRLDPASPEAYNNRWWMHAVAGELRKARADCDQALRPRPGFLDDHDSRGLGSLKSGALRAVVSDDGEALKRDARHSSALHLHGRGLAPNRLGDGATGRRDRAGAFEPNPQIDRDFATYGVR